jgi:hypothetical protein
VSDDDWYEPPVFFGMGQTHDLRDADSNPRNPRNPRLAGLKSVSYAAAVAMAKTPKEPKRRRIGFHRPKRRA